MSQISLLYASGAWCSVLEAVPWSGMRRLRVEPPWESPVRVLSVGGDDDVRAVWKSGRGGAVVWMGEDSVCDSSEGAATGTRSREEAELE